MEIVKVIAFVATVAVLFSSIIIVYYMIFKRKYETQLKRCTNLLLYGKECIGEITSISQTWDGPLGDKQKLHPYLDITAKFEWNGGKRNTNLRIAILKPYSDITGEKNIMQWEKGTEISLIATDDDVAYKGTAERKVKQYTEIIQYNRKVVILTCIGFFALLALMTVLIAV